MGTDTGGFTAPAIANAFRNADTQNAVTIGHVGTGATMALSNSATPTLMANYNSNYGIVPYRPDNTVMGGNARGAFSVDLQTIRSDPTQVASGQSAVVSGGNGNMASGQWSAVPGGVGNVASGTSAIVLGGNGNTATGANSVAMGNGSQADLFACVALSSGWIAGGQRLAQNMRQVLVATTAANTTPVRLTADGAAAGAANTVNLTALSTLQLNNIRVQLVAVDSSTGSNRYVWSQPGTPAILTSGTTAGIAITEAADTTRGAYSLTFTPPTGNASIWRVVATVEWTRVDGS
jgi:hypothetical protein